MKIVSASNNTIEKSFIVGSGTVIQVAPDGQVTRTTVAGQKAVGIFVGGTLASTGNLIQTNTISDNSGDGISITSTARSTMIGSHTNAQDRTLGNTIIRNGGDGINTDGVSTKIGGNFIGVLNGGMRQANGTGNGGDGIRVGDKEAIIGGFAAGKNRDSADNALRNVISANGGYGVFILGFAIVEGNYIGLTVDGSADVDGTGNSTGNGRIHADRKDGVFVDGRVGNKAMGTTIKSNYVGGNVGYGIRVIGAAGNLVTNVEITNNAVNASRFPAGTVVTKNTEIPNLPAPPVNAAGGVFLQYAKTYTFTNNVVVMQVGGGNVVDIKDSTGKGDAIVPSFVPYVPPPQGQQTPGVLLENCWDTEFTGGSYSCGIQIINSSNIVVSGNEFGSTDSSLAYGVSVDQASTGVVIGSTATSAANFFTNISDAAILVADSSVEVTNNLFTSVPVGLRLNSGAVATLSGSLASAVEVNGGSLQASAGASVDSLSLFAGSVTITSGVAFDVSGPVHVVNGEVFLLFGSSLTVSGSLTISGGIFHVASATLNAALGVSIETTAGELVVDNGIINGSLTSNGHLTALGASQINGDLTLLPSSVLSFLLSGNQPGEYSTLDVSGQIDFGGLLHLDTTMGYVPANGDIFDLMTYGSRVGFFWNITGPSGGAFTSTYDDSNGLFSVGWFGVNPMGDTSVPV